jgi:hypothetical protein
MFCFPRVQLQDYHKHGTRRELKTFMFVLFHNWNNNIFVYKYISHALASKAQWQILFAHNKLQSFEPHSEPRGNGHTGHQSEEDKIGD